MSPITAKKKSAKNQANETGKKLPFDLAGLIEPKKWLLLIGAGALLGLSAPGLEQWYLAWLGLIPLLLATTSEPGMVRAFLRGTAFGAGYSLSYFNWLLGLQPLDWLLFNWWQGWLIACAAWVIVSGHQALIIGIFSAVLNKIPLTGSFIPRKVKGSWRLPALLVVPILWTLICNFICNAHSATGVPWTMLEYSQYRLISLIQIANIIGGVGIGCLIVMTNTALAGLVLTFLKKSKSLPLAAENKSFGIYQVMAVSLVLVGCLIYGQVRVSAPSAPPDLTVTVMQGNINIEMQKTVHKYTLTELFVHYTQMLRRTEKGIVVWTESALPTYLAESPATLTDLATIAKAQGIDMIIGSLDHDKDANPYNSAFGIDSNGRLFKETYHKRFLVPFGEYTPVLVEYMPEWMRRLTNTPAGGGFSSGKDPVSLELTYGKVAPLICFETLSPELVASSARRGGQLLVNISDLAWFHKSCVGEQMLAFSVMRAVENSRYFVFAANTGPSAIIDAKGRIMHLSKQNIERLLVGKVKLSSEITPFTRWFVF
jgi:apolipoprotein N-acyltransferase